jgi:hypothetical protein
MVVDELPDAGLDEADLGQAIVGGHCPDNRSGVGVPGCDALSPTETTASARIGTDRSS